MKKIPINYENQQSMDKASHIVYKFAGMYNKCSESVRFRQSDAVCRKCGRDLEVYYCENGLYAVRCVFCGMLTLIDALSPDNAAERVGITAMSIKDDYIEEDGEVICIRYPVEDISDVRFSIPTAEEDLPKDFTHFIPFVLPHMPKGGRNDEDT